MNNLAILANDIAPVLIPVILVAFFGVIVGAVIIVRKKTKLFGDHDEGPKSEKEVADEELNRLLVDVDNDETQAEMDKFAKEEEVAKEAAVEEEGEDKPIL